MQTELAVCLHPFRPFLEEPVESTGRNWGSSLMDFFWVGLGGFFGALTRYGVGRAFLFLGTGFPYGTMVANITGSFLLGFIQVLALERFLLTPRVRLMLGVGFCGAYTTFSTFTRETFNLIHHQLLLPAFLYNGGTAVLCLLGAWLGMVAGRALSVALANSELLLSKARQTPGENIRNEAE
ncbi:MAG: fluoride efflux transporter CrcB [Bacillota bacterium]|nr:fluoride efflux transporter CrcB [Bacillota bacterium]